MSIGASLSKQVGPMPIGAWLLVGGGGLFIAYRSRTGSSTPAAAPATDPLPTGGSAGAVQSWDNAPVVLSPIFEVPSVPVTITLPTAPPTSTPGAPTPTTPPPAPPRVPAPSKPAAPAPAVITYTVKKGDTLWGIALRQTGNPLNWTRLYAANKPALEAAAQHYGHASSNGGNLIFPGTALRITK